MTRDRPAWWAPTWCREGCRTRLQPGCRCHRPEQGFCHLTFIYVLHAYLGLDEPVILIDDVLVVGVVEGVSLAHGPGVLEQRVRHGHAPDGVRPHDGRRLAGREVELVAEEVQRRVTVTWSDK